MTEVNGNKVFIENGDVKTILREDIQKSGWMDIDTACNLTIEKIRKIYEMNNAL